MNHQQALNLRRYRTLTGQARKVALREHFAAHGVPVGQSYHTFSQESRAMLATVAKAVCWRKPIGCPLNLAQAFYNYMTRGA
jgi:hypothetical protein